MCVPRNWKLAKISGENWAKIFAAFNKLLLLPYSRIFEKYWFLVAFLAKISYTEFQAYAFFRQHFAF